MSVGSYCYMLMAVIPKYSRAVDHERSARAMRPDTDTHQPCGFLMTTTRCNCLKVLQALAIFIGNPG